MKSPRPMMPAMLEGPHCPVCHCGWFRTLNLSGPLSKWIRQCKHCGTEYSTDESLMLGTVIEGEANYECVLRHEGSGTAHVYEGVTMEEAANKALHLLSSHSVVTMPTARKEPVVTVVRHV
jgi:hypothetical protein